MGMQVRSRRTGISMYFGCHGGGGDRGVGLIGLVWKLCKDVGYNRMGSMVVVVVRWF